MILGPILEIVSKFIPDADKQAEIKKEIMQHEEKIETQAVKYAEADLDLRIKEMEHTGFKSWWRPFAMFGFSMFVLLYLFLYYIVPALIVYFDLNVYAPQMVELPDMIWYTYMVVILGVSGLRTIDKFKR